MAVISYSHRPAVILCNKFQVIQHCHAPEGAWFVVLYIPLRAVETSNTNIIWHYTDPEQTAIY